MRFSRIPNTSPCSWDFIGRYMSSWASHQHDKQRSGKASGAEGKAGLVPSRTRRTAHPQKRRPSSSPAAPGRRLRINHGSSRGSPQSGQARQATQSHQETGRNGPPLAVAKALRARKKRLRQIPKPGSKSLLRDQRHQTRALSRQRDRDKRQETERGNSSSGRRALTLP